MASIIGSLGLTLAEARRVALVGAAIAGEMVLALIAFFAIVGLFFISGVSGVVVVVLFDLVNPRVLLKLSDLPRAPRFLVHVPNELFLLAFCVVLAGGSSLSGVVVLVGLALAVVLLRLLEQIE